MSKKTIEVDLDEIKGYLEKMKTDIESVNEKIDKHLHKELLNSCKSLLSITEDLIEKPDQVAKNISEMNELNNLIFEYLRKNKIEKEIKKILVDVIRGMYKINLSFGFDSIIVKEYDNGRYEGYMKNEKREGKGTYYYCTGDVYTGEFKNDLKDGKGVYNYSNKDKYEGEYKEGKI